MAKNLIPVIADCLGVRIGEKFKLKYDGHIIKNLEKEKIYRFTDTELEEQDYRDNLMWNGAHHTLELLV